MLHRASVAARLYVACVLVIASSNAQDPLFRRLDGPIQYDFIPTVVGVGDLTSDGAAEILFSDGIGVNDGSGRVTWTPWSGPSSSEDSVIADLNGDQFPDFAATMSGYLPGQTRVPFVAFGGPGPLLGSAAPGIPSPPTTGNPPTPAWVRSVDAGDVDGDGDVDLMWLVQGASHQVYYTMLWANDGSGGFTPAIASASMPPNVGGLLRLVDVDLDGDLDAVVLIYLGNLAATYGSGTLYVSTNAGGVFGVPTTVATAGVAQALALGDVDGDGSRDVIVYANGLFQVCVATTAGLSVGPVVAGGGGYAPVLVDFDADAILDLAEFATDGAAIRGLTPSGASAAPLVSAPHVRVARGVPTGRHADFDGDGDVDLLVATPVSYGLWMNGGGATTRLLEDRFGATVSAGWSEVAGDFDGDGAIDRLSLSCTNQAGVTTFRISRNDGHGFFFPAGETTLPLTACGAIIPFDRDGDGDDDLLLIGASATTPGFDVVLDSSSGTFSVAASVQGAVGYRSHRAELDGDGDEDLVLVNQSVGTVHLRYGDHVNGLSAPVFLVVPGFVNDAVPGDFDGDGDPDVLVVLGTPFGGVATLWRNDGGPPDALVWTPVAQPAMAGWTGHFASAGRFDGDATTDVALGGTIYFGGPTGVLVSGPPLSPPILDAAASADVDGDGLEDLIERFGPRRPNLGGGVFGPPIFAINSAGLPAGVPPLVRDFDQDGDLDSLHLGGNAPVLLLNTTRQLARGAVARPGRNASLDLFGAPGGSFTLFASTGPASVGAGPWGTVLIDPANAVLAAFGAHPAAGPSAGRTSLSFAVPNYPAFVGLSLYWQAVDDATFHVTNRLVTEVYGF
jgi:hypothetical protein